MSSINPSNGVSGSTPSSSTSSSSSTPSSSSSSSSPTTTDSISSSGTVGAPHFSTPFTANSPTLTQPGAFSLLQYASFVSGARVDLQTQDAYSNELGFLVTKEMWGDAVGVAAAIRAYYQSVVTYWSAQTTLAGVQISQSNSVTPAINAYNSTNNFTADQNAINTMNQAISDYNAGNITQAAFNTAVSTYNSYASTHNLQSYVTNYNTQASIYNAGVASFNAQATAANAASFQTLLPPIPLETPLPSGSMQTQQGSPPLTAGSIPPIPAMPNPIPSANPQVIAQSFSDAINSSGFQDFVNKQLGQINILDNKLLKANAYRDLNTFIHRDILDVQNPPYAPSSYIQQQNQGNSPSSSGTGAAMSSGYTALASGQAALSLPRVLGLSIYTAACQQAQVPPYIADVLEMANFAIGQQGGLLSAAPGVKSIDGESLGSLQGNDLAIKILAALGFVNVVRGLVNSKDLSDIIGNLLTSENISPEDKDKLTKVITAGFQLSLIEQAIFQVANAIGLPGSVSQILGNLNGVPNISSILGSAATPTVNDVLNNSYQVNALKNNLVTQLTISNPALDKAQADQIVSNALNETIANAPYDSTYVFSTAYQTNLENQGLDEATAAAQADQARSLVNSEINSQNLDETVVADQVNTASQNSDQVTQNAVQSSVNNSNLLADQQTVRDIRDALLKELTLQNYAFNDALLKADQYASLLTGNRLAQEFSAQVLNESLLQQSIADTLAKQGGDPSLAASIAGSILQGNYTSAAQARDAIYSQLVAAGISVAAAHAAADNAQLVSNNADAFLSIGGANIVSANQIFAKIQSTVYSTLSLYLDNPNAQSVAEQLAAAVVGSPTNTEINRSDRENPVSLLNQANDQIAALRQYADDQTIQAALDTFREVMRPTDNLFYIVELQNQPGQDLINMMSLMNAGHGNHPSDYQHTIDIPV